MSLARILRAGALCGLVVGLTACGGGIGSGGISSGTRSSQGAPKVTVSPEAPQERLDPRERKSSTIWSLFNNNDNPNTTVEVNRYIWNAALDVLNFLPIESVDPFSGVIVTGYGRPPGGGRAYRATIYVQDAALDARSLKVALATRGGPVSAATQRKVEDAILTRARQLRIADGKL
ncbi:DUF3576 domain-containing protein [Acidimangrovimonas pyrenivorans]|uniref:DUF3576 domain-containing protein n=1 Tax=Acidimangrovimonas pyrenivorans TaxID=2030798 RepID=A0ABV7AKT2_9RHOB